MDALPMLAASIVAAGAAGAALRYYPQLNQRIEELVVTVRNATEKFSSTKKSDSGDRAHFPEVGILGVDVFL